MEKRITPSLVISVIALIVALGGASYAAIKIPKNSVGTKQLKKNAVATAKIKNSAVTTAKIKKNAVRADQIGTGAVGSTEVEDGSLGRGDFVPGQINGNTYFGRRTGSTTLPLTGDMTAIATTPVLPAGSYVLWGRANILGSAANSVLICSMENDAAQNFDVAPGTVFPLSMSAIAVLTEPQKLSLSCLKSAGNPEVAQAHIIATSVNSIIESGSSD